MRELPPASRRALVLGTLALALFAILATGPGCGPQFGAQQAFVRTGTVSATTQRTIIIDTPVALDVQGVRSGNEITWRVDGTVSATSAGAAQNLADLLDVVVEAADPNAITLILPNVAPQDGLLEGTWTVSAPFDFNISVAGRGPGQQLSGIAGNVAVDAVSGVVVLGASGDVAIRTGNAEVLVDSVLPPGRTIGVQANGNIQVALPLQLSASIVASITEPFGVDVRHSQLPPWNSNLPTYSAVVGGGLSRVELVSRSGNIFITPPL